MRWQQRPCKNTLCNATTKNVSGYCDKCNKDKPAPRPRLSSYKRGYDHKWRKARAVYLRDNPLCVMCRARQIVTAASVVDHIEPHKGDDSLFWNRDNWQSLCKRCHDSDKQRIERNGLCIY